MDLGTDCCWAEGQQEVYRLSLYSNRGFLQILREALQNHHQRFLMKVLQIQVDLQPLHHLQQRGLDVEEERSLHWRWGFQVLRSRQKMETRAY